jgi:endonuclease-3 related protein
MEIYQRLFDAYGPQRWWPGDTRLEVIIGAILTQNTAWSNVEKAIANLKRERLLSLEALGDVDSAHLAKLLRPSGYFNQKAKKLKVFVSYVHSNYNGSLRKMAQVELAFLREELLGIFGIGPETADSILLYAFQKPIFVVDAYTKRIFSRHHFFGVHSSYPEVQRFFMKYIPLDIALFNEYHALIVRTGHLFCRTRPLCESCPLEFHLSRVLDQERRG